MKHTDTELLDFLQSMLDRKRGTGKVVVRDSENGNGIVLQESSEKNAVDNIRLAIANFLDDTKTRACVRCGSYHTCRVDHVEGVVDPLHVESIYTVDIFRCCDCGHHWDRDH